jgi:acyl-CoA synthetase (AMP-forming)/AMP-acid ligase II
MDVARFAANVREFADKPAVIMADTGEALTYAELNARSNRGAHFLRSLGLRSGDTLALCAENAPHFFHVACAALRSGLTLVPVSTKLTASELAFIVRDSGAKAVVLSEGTGEAYFSAPQVLSDVLLIGLGREAAGYRSWDAGLASQPETPLSDEGPGREMLYSSGTTGRPKGIVYGDASGVGTRTSRAATRMLGMLGVGSGAVYLSPAPLYHSAPFGWAIGMLELGGTTVVMPRFEPELALSLIERYRVNVSQWVPTHFSRMLKLAPEIRNRYDVSSLKVAIHAAAPCPVPVKREMIEWWGPIILEYFGSSEQTALTFITSQEWLAHPGSVGKCVLGKLYICDDHGDPLPTGKIGEIHAEGAMAFAYHNDSEKTAKSRNRHGWTTVGDVGYLDDEGYLYLTDRKNFTIISGGVNIYPQEIENLLITHPRVADVAVIGTPDPDYGEKVTAVIQPLDMADANDTFRQELIAWMRPHLSRVKMPKQIDFRAELPRLPTGKMAKHVLRAAYLENEASRP